MRSNKFVAKSTIRGVYSLLMFDKGAAVKVYSSVLLNNLVSKNESGSIVLRSFCLSSKIMLLLRV